MKVLNVFDNVKLPLKMGLIGLLVLVALALPIYFYSQLSIEAQNESEQKFRGIHPTSNVVHLKRTMAEHRGLAVTYLNGERSKLGALNKTASQIDERIKKLEADLSHGNVDAAIVDHLRDINVVWKSIRSHVSSGEISAADSFAEHSELIKDTELIISELSKFYLLSYDHVAGSYHAIVANFQDLPRLADALKKVRSVGVRVLTEGTPSEADKAALEAYMNNAVSPLQDLIYNMDSAALADTRFVNLARDIDGLNGIIEQLQNLVTSEILNRSKTDYNATQFYSEYSQLISNLYTVHDKSMTVLSEIVQERATHEQNERTFTLGLVAGMIVISGVIGLAIVLSVTRSANNLIGYFNEISEGNYELDLNVNRKDEMGILEAELSTLNEQLEASAELAIEARRVKQALDNGSSCFVMSNAKGEIVYMNDALYKMFKRCEADFRKQIPHFTVDSLLGSQIDTFHTDPSHPQKVIEQINTDQTVDVEIGGYSFKLSVNNILDKEGNSLGASVEWYDMTAVYEEERRVARILEALDSASTNIMIADSSRDIVYLNDSVKDMLKDAEAELKTIIPQFDANKVVGRKVDSFFSDPKHQRGLEDGLASKFESQIHVGDRHFRLTTSAVKDDDGNRIGTVVEWVDRTIEMSAEREIADIVEASLQGNFSKRIDEKGKQEFMLTLAQGLNQLTNTTETGLNEVSEVLLAISKGDLTKRVESDFKGTFEDLKNYCNTTSANLAMMINKIRVASDTINSASSEIAAGNSDLSVRTEQQASSLEETASSMEELTNTVKLNAENADQANSLASQAAQVADNGGTLISQVVDTMSSINDSSQKISDIIGVIDGIAFQTNILALNAAVEAARAGEQGRGFAVVASEVRTLAQRSANAAKDIKDLISDSVAKVESGNQLVNQSGDTMHEIVVSIQRVNDIMGEIAAASSEQAGGIEEVSKAISQMDEMTQQNAALVEQAAATAESMRTQAVDLNDRVGYFTLEKQSDELVEDEAYDTSVSVAATPKTKVTTPRPAAPKRKQEVVPTEDDDWESF